MISKLISETGRQNTIEEVKIFSPSSAGERWECPFCDPSRAVYSLNIPPENELEIMLFVKRRIREHIELHQKDLLSKMMSEREYESVKLESVKRVRSWITGTIAVRKLYKEDPLQNQNYDEEML